MLLLDQSESELPHVNVVNDFVLVFHRNGELIVLIKRPAFSVCIGQGRLVGEWIPSVFSDIVSGFLLMVAGDLGSIILLPAEIILVVLHLLEVYLLLAQDDAVLVDLVEGIFIATIRPFLEQL